MDNERGITDSKSTEIKLEGIIFIILIFLLIRMIIKGVSKWIIMK